MFDSGVLVEYTASHNVTLEGFFVFLNPLLYFFVKKFKFYLILSQTLNSMLRDIW